MKSLREWFESFLERRRVQQYLLSMDQRMLNDLGISEVDALQYAGVFDRSDQPKEIHLKGPLWGRKTLKSVG